MSLTRKKPIGSGKALARTGRLRTSNRARKAKRYARDFGDEAALVRSLPCLVCGATSIPAHVTSRGAGGGRFDIVPLCSYHHDEQHCAGVVSFAAKYEIDLRAEADRVALLHEAPLGVQGLAQRWDAASWCGCTDGWVLPGGNPHEAYECTRCERLDDYEREALFGLARRRMAGVFSSDRETLAYAVMKALSPALDADPHGEHGQAWTLCEQAGWPS